MGSGTQTITRPKKVLTLTYSLKNPAIPAILDFWPFLGQLFFQFVCFPGNVATFVAKIFL